MTVVWKLIQKTAESESVKGDRTTTRLRVVFKGPTKMQYGVSINDMLLNPPKLQADIKVFFTADIKQMYRQILIEIEHQDYQWIVRHNSLDEPIKDYRLHTVTYGVSSTPYLAIHKRKHLAEDEQQRFPKAANILQTNGQPVLLKPLHLQKELIVLLRAGGFQLRKFTSYHREVLPWLSPDELQPSQLLSFDKDNYFITKVLGLHWGTTSDCLSIHIPPTSMSQINCGVLSEVARIFDPLRWLTPVPLFAKTLMQQLWLKCEHPHEEMSGIHTIGGKEGLMDQRLRRN
ncbi:hypothetical protein PR048_026897 [Dryococelus australis]|uniref:Reverse transcriptase domain-containing protein n=1 Tax=Dryococelus australis TaxID=614101 RepID=A0ABQ9GMM1_9NEOP|nr:hypothetical protein PR048_026897 [Dryococelus australis]